MALTTNIFIINFLQVVDYLFFWESKFLINLSENERGADLKTYAYYRNEIQKISIDKFKEASGFECSVEMMEDSIKSFKSDIFDYKLLANAHKR